MRFEPDLILPVHDVAFAPAELKAALLWNAALIDARQMMKSSHGFIGAVLETPDDIV